MQERKKNLFFAYAIIEHMLNTISKVLIIVSLIAIGIGAYNIYTRSSDEFTSKYKTIKPQTRLLKQEVEVDAQVEPKKNIDVSSEIPGKIEWFAVSEGDTVRQGQHVVTIEHSELLVALQQAQANLAKAKAELAKAKQGARQEDLEIAKEQVTEADLQVSSAKTSLASAVRTLSDVVDTQMDVIDKYYEEDEDEGTFDLSIQHVDSVYVNALNQDRKLLEAELDSLYSFASKLQDADYVKSIDVSEFLTKAEKVSHTLSQIKELTNSIESAVSDALETLNRANLKAAQADMQIVRPKIETEKAKLDASISQLRLAQAKYKQAKIAHEKLQAGTRKEDIEALEAAVRLAEAQVASAQAKLDKAKILSPATGQVSKTYKEVGEFVQASEPIFSIITGGVFVKAQVPEVDISKVKLNMDVDVKFDAYKSKRFKGKVYFIYPTQKEINNIVYYEVKILLDEKDVQDYEILPGMTASVYIPTVDKEVKVSIPSHITQKDDGGTFVYVLDRKGVNPNVPQKRYIKLGVTDGKYVEVLSGLSLSDKVVIDG